jgi:peptide/nickel transport system permease protein
MLNFILKRLFYGFLVILGVITVVFLLFNVLPGDPARMMLGQRADIASVDAINKDLGRDKPLITQYFNYLNDLSVVSIHNTVDKNNYWYLDSTKYSAFKLFSMGNDALFLKKPYLRRSYQSKRMVTEIITEAFPKTALLAAVSMLFAFVI